MHALVRLLQHPRGVFVFVRPAAGAVQVEEARLAIRAVEGVEGGGP